MTDLLPFLPSDEEDDDKDNVELMQKDKVHQNKIKNEIDDDDSEDENDDEMMNESFQFGGILGEDGVLNVDTTSYTQNKALGWSYQRILQEQDGEDTNTPSRMDVNTLIEAKRKSILKEKKKERQRKQDDKDIMDKNIAKSNNNLNLEKDEDKETWEGDDDDDDNTGQSHADDDEDDQNNSNSDHSSQGSSEDDDDDNDEDEDEKKHPEEEDTLKARERRIKKKKQQNERKDDNDNQSMNDNDDDDDDDDDDDENDGKYKSDREDKLEAEKAANFYDKTDTSNDRYTSSSNNKIEVFAQLTLSRPLLRGIAAMGFVQPTPIQASVIPIALNGRDICASAVTGSGKTAAFVLPVLERLLHRTSSSKSRVSSSSTKALILTPTRELAAQCVSMMSTFMHYITNIRTCLIVGGTKNVQAQAAELRTRPDVIVATPGRLLDHITNSSGVILDDVEFLVLDEADRLLDLGFQDEIMEIMKLCPPPHNRQTLLFSATMNTKVDDLIKLSLKRPVRIHISDQQQRNIGTATDGSNYQQSLEVAPRLEQEFIRIRSNNEATYREGILLALLTRTYQTQTIVFFDTKVNAHRIMILCGLCGMKCTELHGNLTQQQRLTALEDFKSGAVDILLATDLAARGLDIDRVKAVINFDMPNSVETYIHRIGRTARAGRSGKSCTLIGENKRHLMKEVIKDSEKKAETSSKEEMQGNGSMIRTRTIPSTVIAHFASKIQSLEDHVKEVLEAEAVAKMDRITEMELTKAKNLIEHHDEIQNRPQKEWYKSEARKKLTKAEMAEKAKMIAEKVGTGMHRMTRKKRRKREAEQSFKDDLANSSNNQNQDNDDNDDNDDRMSSKAIKKLKMATPSAIKASAKKDKREKAKDKVQSERTSLYDEDKRLEQKLAKKKKKRLGIEAIGDSSLFEDEQYSYSKPKKNTVVANKNDDGDGGGTTPDSFYKFRGFDPNQKLGKNKKKGHSAFKSKSKFKRRK